MKAAGMGDTHSDEAPSIPGAVVPPPGAGVGVGVGVGAGGKPGKVPGQCVVLGLTDRVREGLRLSPPNWAGRAGPGSSGSGKRPRPKA